MGEYNFIHTKRKESMDKQPVTIGDVIFILIILLFLFWIATYQVWYSVINHAPECVVAQDVITCVKVKRLGGE